MVAESTRVFGDIILKALKEGETPEAISRRIGEYATSSYGLKLEDMDLAMIVGGYALYFN